MKPTIKQLVFGALLGVSLPLQAAPTLVPNGDFETPGGASWAEANGDGAAFSYSYPATGGNPDGYGIIDNTFGGSWGIWVGNGDATIPLSSLGLTAGKTYYFTMDMKILSGANIGGLKVDFFTGGAAAGSTGDKFPFSGGTTDWANYPFRVTIPAGADGIKVVPLWGRDSSVGFDNLYVDPTPVSVPHVPNGDFEDPNGLFDQTGGAYWGFFQGGSAGADHTVSYPTSGGNPGSYAEIDASAGGGYAGIAANGNAPITLDTLGLTAGETYTFTMDMKIISGPSIGQFKVEFVPGGTGDLPATLVGNGSTWENYSFDVTIPAGTTQIIIVPLWGPDSVVGIDNVDIVIPVEAPFAAEIKTGTLVSWTASSPDNTYQAQESPDNATWTDLGPAVTGDTVTSAFDSDGSPFYQVVETTPDLFFNSFFNEGFELTETPGYPSTGAEDWTIQSPEDTDPSDGTATMTVESSYDIFSPHGGTEMLVIESTTPAAGPVLPPNTNVVSAFTSVDENASYTLSFYAAHAVKNGGANPQFNIRFYDDFNGYLGETGFESFAAIHSNWTKVEKSFTTPANTFWLTIEWIQAMGADLNGQWVTLIDDVDLPVFDSPGTPSTIAATSAPGLELSWPTKAGNSYQVRKSAPDLSSFADFGPAIIGDGNTWTATDLITPLPGFYEVIQTP